MSADVRYPKIEVELSGQDGNAFMIIGRVRTAMRKAGVPHEELDTFSAEAMNGDYDHVLRTCLTWVKVI